MIKLVYCITKRPDLSDEEFFRYWKNIHGPIGAHIPRLRKLIQSHRINIPGDKYPPSLRRHRRTLVRLRRRPARSPPIPRMASLNQDEANFIDHTKVAYFVTEEHIIM